MSAFTNSVSGTDNAIEGTAVAGTGVAATSRNGIGVVGVSRNNEGVRGMSSSEHAGVVGINDSPDLTGTDVRLVSVVHLGVEGPTSGGSGGWFESISGEGVRGWSHTGRHGGVVGVNTGGGAGVYGQGDAPGKPPGVGVHGKGRRLAGFFEGRIEVVGDAKYSGDLEVTGNLNMTGVGSDIVLVNADCAEDFDVTGSDKADPGTVMVLGNEGALSESQQAYDKRVAGVISGAGDYKPAIVLDKQQTSGNRQPIALMGKVFCKVDAQFGAIEVGDLLTTSPTPGHAMAVSEPVRAFGTIIGKALRSFSSGKGLIPILVALQ